MSFSKLLENIGWRKNAPKLYTKEINLQCVASYTSINVNIPCKYQNIIESLFIYYNNTIIYEKYFSYYAINNVISIYYWGYNTLFDNDLLVNITHNNEQTIVPYYELNPLEKNQINIDYIIQPISNDLINKPIIIEKHQLIIKNIVMHSVNENKHEQYYNIYCILS